MINARRSLIAAGILTLLSSAPCFAMASWFPAGNHGHHEGHGVSRSAPGPELGVGLSAVVAGAYFWYRRRRQRRGK